MGAPPVTSTPSQAPIELPVHQEYTPEQTRAIKFMKERMYCAIASGDHSEFRRIKVDLVQGPIAQDLGQNVKRLHGNLYEWLMNSYSTLQKKWAPLRRSPPVPVCTIDREKRTIYLPYEHGWKFYLAERIARMPTDTQDISYETFVRESAHLPLLQERLDILHARYGGIDRLIAEAQKSTDPRKALDALEKARDFLWKLRRNQRAASLPYESKAVQTWAAQRLIRINEIYMELLPLGQAD